MSTDAAHNHTSS